MPRQLIVRPNAEVNMNKNNRMDQSHDRKISAAAAVLSLGISSFSNMRAILCLSIARATWLARQKTGTAANSGR